MTFIVSSGTLNPVNPRHVLYQLLPPEKDTGYNLRQRSHHLTLPFTDNNMIRKNFLHIMLFMDTY